MSRVALIAAACIASLAMQFPARALDPHVDSTLLQRGCRTCHAGHGMSRSPMLHKPQKDLCLECHGTVGAFDRRIQAGELSASARPLSISDALEATYAHPVSDGAFSRHEPGTVTCTSCHSPHRAVRGRASRSDPRVGKRFSPRNPQRFEYELCGDCHGGEGIEAQSPLDISRRFDPNSRSYHPVRAPARDTSPSLFDRLSGSEISCTHCHGNSDARGSRGLHGSSVRNLLNANYTGADGDDDGPATYALCYRCHDRERVLDSPRFPEHRRHVVDLRASCSTCHDPHGAIDARALIRFEETVTPGSVLSSASTGVLRFESDVPGSGTCWLSCHGFDHAPEVYGGAVPGPAPLRRRGR